MPGEAAPCARQSPRHWEPQSGGLALSGRGCLAVGLPCAKSNAGQREGKGQGSVPARFSPISHFQGSSPLPSASELQRPPVAHLPSRPQALWVPSPRAEEGGGGLLGVGDSETGRRRH